MITINGKKYKINMDMKWGTQKLLKLIQEDPDDLENIGRMEEVLKDILKPKPTIKAMANFRNSDIEKIFVEFGKDISDTNADLKKKLSR